VTPQGKLQTWQILTDIASLSVEPATEPATEPTTALPSIHTTVIDPQRAWHRLLILLGQQPQQVAMPLAAVSSSAVTPGTPSATSPASTAQPVTTASRLPAFATYSVLPGSATHASSPMTGITLSLDGQLIATATPQGGLEIRQVQADQSTKLVRRILNRRWLPGQTVILSEVVNSATAGSPVNPPASSTASEPLRISQLSFSPDSRQVMGIGDDLTVRLWNVQTGQLLNVLQGHAATIQQARFSPDGQQIVTASWDKTVRIWGSYFWANAEGITAPRYSQ
ncbi:MAG: WD40 repeat domain-containing protein, partial [Leptolyngbyaceae cyanobacterium CRU_2_3]|nr:WD40 repeat domain-containing protein [Leptolyngbyaceae cyanobacterium CRU_2_3]